MNIKNILHKIIDPVWASFVILCAVLVVCGLLGWKFYKNADARIKKSEQDISMLESMVNDEREHYQKSLESIAGDMNALRDSLNLESSKITSTVGQISSSVGLLEKLSRTDPELLKKYSKVYFLNEHYIPISIYAIPKEFTANEKVIDVHSSILVYLMQLISTANASGLGLEVESGYRSFSAQAELKQQYRVTYGAGTANSFSAEQGYSEHQLGTAVDFSTKSLGGGLAGFDKTPEYQWLMDNAYKYGFVISYPKENTYYVFEPWHWRFVGVALATKIHNDNTFFYNLDQRVIDSYLVNIFD